MSEHQRLSIFYPVEVEQKRIVKIYYQVEVKKKYLKFYRKL